MSSSPWTREDWNNIITQVNDLAANPDAGCDPLDPLPLVDPDHIWTTSDITGVRDLLTQICKDNNFSTETRLWSQEIIDEIQEAIDNGWCDCRQCCPGDEQDIQILELRDLPPQHNEQEDTECNNCNWYYPQEDINHYVLKDLVAGMQVASPPVPPGLTWTVVKILDGEPNPSQPYWGDCNAWGCKRRVYGGGTVPEDGLIPSDVSFWCSGQECIVSDVFTSIGIVEHFQGCPPHCAFNCCWVEKPSTGWTGGRIAIELRCAGGPSEDCQS